MTSRGPLRENETRVIKARNQSLKFYEDLLQPQIPQTEQGRQLHSSLFKSTGRLLRLREDKRRAVS